MWASQHRRWELNSGSSERRRHTINHWAIWVFFFVCMIKCQHYENPSVQGTVAVVLDSVLFWTLLLDPGSHFLAACSFVQPLVLLPICCFSPHYVSIMYHSKWYSAGSGEAPRGRYSSVFQRPFLCMFWWAKDKVAFYSIFKFPLVLMRSHHKLSIC